MKAVGAMASEMDLNNKSQGARHRSLTSMVNGVDDASRAA